MSKELIAEIAENRRMFSMPLETDKLLERCSAALAAAPADADAADSEPRCPKCGCWCEGCIKARP